MKRLLPALLAMLMILVLVGCGGKDSGQSGGGKSGDSSNKSGDNIGSGGGDVYAEDGYGEGRLGDTMHTYFFNFTINSAYTCGEFAGYTPAAGNQLLVVDATVKNTVTSSVEMYDTDFQAQWQGESDEDFRFPITTDPESYEELDPLTDDQLPGTYDLGVNAERTGLLVYEVPAGLKDFSISYLEAFEDGDEGDVFFVFFTAESDGSAASA